MTKYVIRGGKPLHGQVAVSSAKNAAVAILAGTVLAEGPCVIENLPKISDITVQLEILRRLGAKIEMLDDTTVRIDCTKLRSTKVLDDDLARANRASYYFIGALLGRYHTAQVCMPGGCNLGVRAIDQHLKGFEALGAAVSTKAGCVVTDARTGGLHGAHIYLDMPSVGATINIMLAAARAPGQTLIENPAKEPYIVDLANFLNTCGADIRGAGTDVIKIRGARTLHGCTYSVIPDMIEAGTFMAAVAACGGEITLTNVIPKHLDCFATKFMEMGVEMEDLGDAVLVRRIPADVDAADVTTTLEEFAEKLRTGRSPAERREQLLHTMACKSAIKAGMHSDQRELRTLVDRVQSGEIRYCPHGRPVAAKLSRYELEKLFKRA